MSKDNNVICLFPTDESVCTLFQFHVLVRHVGYSTCPIPVVIPDANGEGIG